MIRLRAISDIVAGRSKLGWHRSRWIAQSDPPCGLHPPTAMN